ncbi:hypothetical protein M378DRAFT_732324 [Amanita muscaria Koide BX008]|uniref:Uncharacterized protein n=1 Tax=Amanita muscaria (strain Koide BX008) TaxID=946122 RepID=A0A0C2X2X3_AMAMK|nr:hypothetical protein M378DRAFT_732324 [Amanita muscaria Koide BX008]
MDSRTTIPATPDSLAAMFQKATIDKAENSEFSNSARDMFSFAENNYNFIKEGENLVLVFRRYQLRPKCHTTFPRERSQERLLSIYCGQHD